MKTRTLFFLFLMVSSILMPSSAHWVIGEQKSASEIQAGDTIVMETCITDFAERYLSGSVLFTAGKITDDNIYIVEAGPADIRTGAPTIRLRRLEDSTREEGQNGYLKYNGNWASITYDSIPDDAANLQVLSCEEDIPWSNVYSYDDYQSGVFRDDATYTQSEVANWTNISGRNRNSKSVGFACSTGESYYSDWVFLASWNDADNIMFWHYTQYNLWNVYAVSYEKNFKADLQTLIDIYLSEENYTRGTDPGFYEISAADAYSNVMQEAQALVDGEASEEELLTAISNLKTVHDAVLNAFIPITEGYYYFVSAFEKYYNTYGIEKAVYVPSGDSRLGYKTFEPENADFIFEVTKANDEDEYWVKHLLTGTYVGNPSYWYNARIPVTNGKEEPQNIRYYNLGTSTGKWFWGSHSEHSTSYSPNLTGTSTPADNEGLIHNWGQWGDNTTIGYQYNCWYLRKVTDQSIIDKYTTNYLSYEFDSLTHTATVVASDTSNPYSGNIIIPASVTYNGVDYSVTSIGNYAFLSCSALTSATIPSTVTSIGQQAFQRCSGLTSITIPSTVTNINGLAFSFCSSLTNITVDSNNSIYDSRDGCNAIIETASNTLITGCKKTIIPSSVTGIGPYAFFGCSGLTSVTIPSTVTSIEHDAFSGCDHLTNITVDSNNSIYDSRDGCNAIIETASNTLITGCKNTIIPSSVTGIGSYAFCNCSGLTSITIPNSVTSIGRSAFDGCSNLTSVTLPNSVTNISNYAFYNCSGLTSITIPESVTSIGDRAFHFCRGLTSVTIPESVTSIGDKAFYGCTSLTSINVYWENPNEITLSGLTGSSNRTVYIPEGTLAAYQASSFWSSFNLVERTTIVEDNELSVNDITLQEHTSEVLLPVLLNNTDSISDLQFDLYLPSGFSVAQDGEGNNLIAVSSERTTAQKHLINSQTRTDGSVRIMCTSPTGNTFSGDSGVVVNITISINDTVKVGTYDVLLKNIRISNSDNTYKPADATATITVEEYTPITHTVTYIVDGTVYNTETYEEGAAIIPLAEPAKDGYTFSGWSTIPTTMGSEDIIVTGTFTENTTPVTEPDTDLSQYSNVVYAVNTTAKVGGQTELSINMKNSIEATGYQFDLVLPEGITVAEEDDFPLMDLSLERTTKKKTNTFDCNYQTDGSLRVICNSTGGYAFSGNDGEVAVATLNIASTLEDGEYPIILKNIVVTDATGNQRFTVDRVKSTITLESYTLGDANADGNVDIADYSAIVAKILGHPSSNFVEKAADINGDDIIDVADLSGLAYMILHPNTGSAGSKGYHALLVGAEADNYSAVADTDPTTYDNTLYASTATGTAGGQATLSINMLNDIEATGYQMDIYLPEGVSFALDSEDFPLAELSLARTTAKRTNTFDCSIQTDGALRIICNSTGGYAFNGNDGEVATVVLDIASTLADGNYPIVMKNIVITDATGNERFAVDMMKSTLTVGDVAPVYDENYNLQVVPFQIAAGSDDTEVELLMQNKTAGEIKSVEFDMVLPEGISLYKEDGDYVVDAGSRFASNTIKNRFVCEVEDAANGSLHVSAYFSRTTSSYVFSGTSGDIALMTLVADDALAAGIYTLEMKNIVFNDDNSIKVAPYKASVFVGKPNVTTAVLYGNYTVAAVDALNDCLSSNEKLASIDLSNAVAIEDDSEILTPNDNCVIYVPVGTVLANTDNVVEGDECDNLVLTDGEPFEAVKDFTATTATYTRDITSKYGTICLPYAVGSDASMKYYTLDRVEGNTLYLTEEAEIAAGVPAVFERLTDSGTVSATAANAAIKSTAVVPAGGDLKLIGTYEKLVITDAAELAKSYYISKDQFHQATNSLTVNPFRAYFTYTGSSTSKVFKISTEDDITAIGGIGGGGADVEGIYTADGVKLPALQKGVNIVRYANGKTQKIIVK